MKTRIKDCTKFGIFFGVLESITHSQSYDEISVGAGEIVQWAKAPAANSSALSSIPRTDVVEEQTSFYKFSSDSLCLSH